MHSPVSTRHAILLNFVDRLLGTYIDRHRLGVLFREVVAVRLSGRNVFMPDLAFYTQRRIDAVRQTHVEGAPDLVVEVLGPRTAERDTGPKFAEYEQHGVREYWILDPEAIPQIDAGLLLLLLAVFLISACNNAGGNDSSNDQCTVEGLTCANNADCSATPGAICVSGVCTCE